MDLTTLKGTMSLSGLYKYAILAICVLVVWYIITAIFARRRLGEFPAPSWSAHFSYLWMGRTTYSGKQYWIFRELHRKYGPLVRIGPNEIMTDDPDILREISSVRSTWTRAEWYLTGRFNPYYDNLFTVLDLAKHKKARARVHPAYSGRETGASLEQGINHQIGRLVDLLRRKYAVPGSDAPYLDIGRTSCFFVMDVITKLSFGKEFGYLDEKDHHGFLQEVHDLWPWLSVAATIPWLSNLFSSKPFMKLLGPKPTDKHGFGALMGVSKQHVGEKFSSKDKTKGDMMESFIRHGLSQTECEVEGLFTIVAGTESTAVALRSTLLHVISCPRVYSKLKAEIQETVRSGKISSPISSDEAKRLPYLQSVIYEGIRMRPPLLGLFPKVVPPQGAEFHGKTLPGGTWLCMNTSSLLRSQSLFGKDSEVFRPERFLELREEERAEMQRNAEMAFGHGQHQCMGKHIAFMELYKTTFELLRNFDFQILTPWRPSEDLQSYGVFLESNLLLRVSEAEQ